MIIKSNVGQNKIGLLAKFNLQQSSLVIGKNVPPKIVMEGKNISKIVSHYQLHQRKGSLTQASSQQVYCDVDQYTTARERLNTEEGSLDGRRRSSHKLFKINN